MSKLAQSTSKYVIYARFDAEGTVEKPDVIGAVFGQTEGLLGPDMDLRELQKTGRIGRIDVDLKTVNGKTSGLIMVPSSLDSSETALIAASVETIERVGPCNAKLVIEKIDDVRITKRKYVIDRGKELLERMFDEGAPDTETITEQIKEAIRGGEIETYQGLTAGPDIESYDSIIVVEGRADVVTLLRSGIRNVIAIEGTSVPPAIVELSKDKNVTAFLDGDRGGDLILKELMSVCDVDFVARAPRGKEVEELSKKLIYKSLRSKVPIDKLGKTDVKEPKRRSSSNERIEAPKKQPLKLEKEKFDMFKSTISDLVGTRAACFLNSKMEILGRVPVKEMFSAMRGLDADALVFDGDIDQKLINQCASNGVKYIVGMKTGKIRYNEGVTIITIEDLK
ncbi:MAG: DNA primase DnaG [Candidatus Aenigmatarchaeota archaeon]